MPKKKKMQLKKVNVATLSINVRNNPLGNPFIAERIKEENLEALVSCKIKGRKSEGYYNSRIVEQELDSKYGKKIDYGNSK